MLNIPIIPRFKHFIQLEQKSAFNRVTIPARASPLVEQSAVALRYRKLLAPLNFQALPHRAPRPQNLQPALSFASFAAVCLIRLEENLVSMGKLRRYLVEHPELQSLLDFTLVRNRRFRHGFDPDLAVPTARHLTRLLRITPNSVFQLLLDDTVSALQSELAAVTPEFGQVISLDTKHVIAWVVENNPKAHFKGKRFDKHNHPAGDPDCRLGCKRKRNRRASRQEPPPPTPADEPLPADTIAVGEYYWGYASGVVATKISDWGEFVLAELTQPFDHSDISYFFPLMNDTERRLGFKPRCGAFDAAFDAWYVYDYFYSTEHSGFAAVPFSERGGHKKTFDAHGLPLCKAGLSMPLKYTFFSRRTLVEHECGRHACPLRYSQQSAESCPVNHNQWQKGGCTTTIPTAQGARLRYQLDRQSEAYKQVYNQRTATERINSQAKALGIERPKLRNGKAIANWNTLVYVLINLRALQRIRKLKIERGLR